MELAAPSPRFGLVFTGVAVAGLRTTGLTIPGRLSLGLGVLPRNLTVEGGLLGVGPV